MGGERRGGYCRRDFLGTVVRGAGPGFAGFSAPPATAEPPPETARGRAVPDRGGDWRRPGTTDRPWSQYFCCMVAANREFVRRHPVATKRALRAFLKAIDVCALEPERVARALVEGKFTPRQDYALATLRELPYARWREFNPEDSVRFYALRLQEAGMVKASPGKLIAQGTDWRFLNELKRELKG